MKSIIAFYRRDPAATIIAVVVMVIFVALIYMLLSGSYNDQIPAHLQNL